jgi:hypothetical protein
MTTLADRIVAVASAEIGVAESPPGSNRGPRVEVFQAATSLGGTGWPWCGAFATWCYETAGMPAGDNPGSASTALICSVAAARGELSDTPRVGGLIIWCGTHVGIVVGIGAGVVYTVEGNSGDQVSTHTRAIAGARFVAPRTLGTVLAPPRLYWIDDPGAKFTVKGPWGKEASAERTRSRLSAALQRRATVLRTGAGKYVLRIGDPPRRGPFLDPAKRDTALATLEKSLCRQLVPRSTVSTLPPVVPGSIPSGPAEGLGKTV